MRGEARGRLIKNLKTIAERALALLLGALLLAAGLEICLRLVGAWNEAKLPRRQSGGAYTVLCVGDSFTQGTGAPAGDSYPDQLEKILKARYPGQAFKVVNMGEGGETTALLLKRLPEALLKVRPDAVILLTGVANYWNYWGYNTRAYTGGSELTQWFYRVRVFRLARLLMTDVSAARYSRSVPLNRYVAQENAETRVCGAALGEALTSRKNFKEAIQTCEKAAALNPANATLKMHLGSLYFNSGDVETAREWLLKALEADKKDIRVYTWLATTYQGDAPKVEEWLKAGAIHAGGASAEDFSGGVEVKAWIRADLDRVISAVRAAGVELLVQGYPDEAPDSRTCSELLRAAAAAQALPFIDQAAAFAPLIAAGKRDEYFIRRDPHCSARGYRLMAERLADALAQRPGFISRRK